LPNNKDTGLQFTILEALLVGFWLNIILAFVSSGNVPFRRLCVDFGAKVTVG
jgi:hypothetical protein